MLIFVQNFVLEIDKRIIEFINEHHVLTLATCSENKAYTSNCFYAYDQIANVFICTSDRETKHIKDVLKNNYIAGNIVLETSIIGKIQGLQFNGFMYKAQDEKLKSYKKLYLKRFPFAILKSTDLWFLEPDFFKMTDNRLGFGKKLIWNK